MIITEINCVKFEDLLNTMLEHKEHLAGKYIYGFSVYKAGKAFAFQAYSSSAFRSKDLVGLDVIPEVAKPND